MGETKRKLRGCKVAARSRKNIRECASGFRSFIAQMGISSVGELLEILMFNGLLEVVPDNDERLGLAEACYVPNDRCVYLRDSDYRGVVQGTKPRSKFTFWHEIGHMCLGHDKKFARDASGEVAEHQAYEDSEWQANQFAAEMLMPLDEIRKMGDVSPDVVAKEFGVSYEAAEIRIRNLMKYGEIRKERYKLAFVTLV